MIYETRPVVCDYGIFENGKLKLILNCSSNAELIKEILKLDDTHKSYNTVQAYKNKESERSDDL